MTYTQVVHNSKNVGKETCSQMFWMMAVTLSSLFTCTLLLETTGQHWKEGSHDNHEGRVGTTFM